MTRRTRFSLGLCALLGLLLAGGCGSDGERRRPGGSVKKVTPDAQPCSVTDTSIAAPSGISGALIATDTSGSMKGFAITGSTRLFTLHDSLDRAVRNSLAMAESTPQIRRCYIGSALDFSSSHQLQEFDRATTYTASQSRLNLFFEPIPAKNLPTSVAITSKPEEPVDPLDPYRLSILITDGVQAAAEGGGAGSPCRSGADPECMTYLLRERVKRGYGVWLTLLSLPFQGTHYVERPLDDSHWDRIRSHIATLSGDPYFRDVVFEANRIGRTVPFNSFTFKGVKPILVLALSRDITVGRDFMEKFRELIQHEAVVRPTDSLYSMELAPLEIAPSRVQKISFSGAAPEGVEPVTQKRQGGYYDYLVKCQRNAVCALSIACLEERVVQRGDAPVRFELVPCGGSLPPGHIQIAANAGTGFIAKLDCRNLKEGIYDAWFRLQVTLELETRGPAFWRDLNAENIYETPERLLGLREIVQGVLEARSTQSPVTDCLRIRIERE